MSTVMIGGSSCKVATSTVTYTTLTCTTQSSNAQMANVEVTTGGVAVTSSQQYQYVNPTASVTAVSASTLVVTGGEWLACYSLHLCLTASIKKKEKWLELRYLARIHV